MKQRRSMVLALAMFFLSIGLVASAEAACYECIKKECKAAEDGHQGKSYCHDITACGPDGCNNTCDLFGSSCEGCDSEDPSCSQLDQNYAIEVIPNGEGAPFFGRADMKETLDAEVSVKQMMVCSDQVG